MKWRCSRPDWKWSNSTMRLSLNPDAAKTLSTGRRYNWCIVRQGSLYSSRGKMPPLTKHVRGWSWLLFPPRRGLLGVCCPGIGTEFLETKWSIKTRSRFSTWSSTHSSITLWSTKKLNSKTALPTSATASTNTGCETFSAAETPKTSSNAMKQTCPKPQNSGKYTCFRQMRSLALQI